MFRQVFMLGVASAMIPFAASALTTPSAAPRQAGSTGVVDFSTIKHAQIVDDNGSKIGALDDVVVDGSGRIVQLIIGQGGVLGFGETRRRMDARALPPIMDGKVRLLGQTADTIAALAEYEETEPAQTSAITDPKSVPISGANQMAPQSATTYIPVAPATVTGESVAPGSRATPPPAPNIARVISAEKENAARPGSGMAPQEGTGTSPTQIAPGESAIKGEGNAGAAQPELTAGYAREQEPANQPMHLGSAGDASARRDGSESGPAGVPLASREQTLGGRRAGTASNGSVPDRARWLVGRMIGSGVRGLETGVSVKDVRFAGDRVEAVVLAKGSGRNSIQEVAFNLLNIGGRPQRPQIALNASETARPIEIQNATPTEISR